MHRHLPAAMFVATLAAAAGLVVWTITRVEHQAAATSTRVGWQETDAPPAIPAPPGDPWSEPVDAWLAAAHPGAHQLSPPAPDLAAGDEIHAAADGIVVFAGTRNGEIAVVLGHRAPDGGGRFETTYGPLASTPHRRGQLVGRGQSVGTLTASPWPVIAMDLPPQGVIIGSAGKSPLARSLESASDDWMNLEIGNAERFLELENPPGD